MIVEKIIIITIHAHRFKKTSSNSISLFVEINLEKNVIFFKFLND